MFSCGFAFRGSEGSEVPVQKERTEPQRRNAGQQETDHRADRQFSLATLANNECHRGNAKKPPQETGNGANPGPGHETEDDENLRCIDRDRDRGSKYSGSCRGEGCDRQPF